MPCPLLRHRMTRTAAIVFVLQSALKSLCSALAANLPSLQHPTLLASQTALATEEQGLASKVPPLSQLQVPINHCLRVPVTKYYKTLNVTKYKVSRWSLAPSHMTIARIGLTP